MISMDFINAPLIGLFLCLEQSGGLMRSDSFTQPYNGHTYVGTKASMDET